MDRRQIERTDKRMREDEQAVSATAQEQLVDLGEVEVQADVPAKDPELADDPAWQQASVPADSTAQAGTPAPTRTDELEHFRAKAAEYLDLAQRKEAELRNYAKRSQQ